MADPQYFSGGFRFEIRFINFDLMLTMQIALLLVGAMHFVAVRATITKKVSPNMRIIKDFDVGGTIHQFCVYGLLESVLGAHWR